MPNTASIRRQSLVGFTYHQMQPAGRKRGADALVEPVWRSVDTAVRNILESVTIADVTANAINSPMYYI